MTRELLTLRVHRLLAASHPEPLDPADVVRRLGVPRRSINGVLCCGVRSGCLRQCRPLQAAQGYSYTVAA